MKLLKTITLTPRLQVLSLWPVTIGIWIITLGRVFIRYPGISLRQNIEAALPLIIFAVLLLVAMVYLEIKTRKLRGSNP